jgi:DNA mismatch endonuclease (patch repair protein)
MDTLTSAERSERTSRVRSKDTKPEMWVRRLVHRMGYRPRLHIGSLPAILTSCFRRFMTLRSPHRSGFDD